MRKLTYTYATTLQVIERFGGEVTIRLGRLDVTQSSRFAQSQTGSGKLLCSTNKAKFDFRRCGFPEIAAFWFR